MQTVRVIIKCFKCFKCVPTPREPFGAPLVNSSGLQCTRTRHLDSLIKFWSVQNTSNILCGVYVLFPILIISNLEYLSNNRKILSTTTSIDFTCSPFERVDIYGPLRCNEFAEIEKYVL